MSDKIKQLVTKDRKQTHGHFSHTAYILADLRVAVENGLFDPETEEPHKVLPPEKMYALDMMLVKIARIISGDENFDDHWPDIEGYARIARVGDK